MSVFASIRSIVGRLGGRGDKSRRFISSRMLFFLALRSLTYRKLRTLLTLFGIVVGIGAIFFLLSFGLGLRDLVTQQVIGDRSIKSVDVTSPNSKILKLDTDSVNRMGNLPHVQQVSRTYSFPGIVQFSGSESDAVAYGVDTNYASLNAFVFTAGRNLQFNDDHAAVITSSFLQNWGFKSASEAVGKTFTLTVPLENTGASVGNLDKKFTVAGVIDLTSGSEVFVPGGIFTAVGVPHYEQVKLVADDVSNVSDLRKQVEAMGYVTSSPIDTLDQINQVFKFFTIILAGFGAIGMIVAVLGMFNTLTISLLERTKEIGLMFALGARRSDMYRLFVFEAALLSLMGAVFGIVAAVFLSLFVDILMNALAHSRGVTQPIQLFSYPWWLILGMVVFMLIVGFLVVLFPARRAKKINPIEALRRE